MIAPRTALLVGTHVAAMALGSLLFDGLVHQPHLKADAQRATKQVIAARAHDAKAETIARAARDQLDTQKETIRVQTREIVKAIPVYLPAPVEGLGGTRDQDGRGGVDGRDAGDRLSLPVGFGRLHDYAALGVDPPVPAPSREPLGSPSGIGLPALAGTIAENYGVCRADWAEVMAWREWYQKEAAAWPSK